MFPAIAKQFSIVAEKVGIDATIQLNDDETRATVIVGSIPTLVALAIETAALSPDPTALAENVLASDVVLGIDAATGKLIAVSLG
jgi:hypothetical protein